MTLSALQWLSVFAAPLLLGAALLRGFGIRFDSDRLAYLGWCWMTGCLALGLLLFAWTACGGVGGPTLFAMHGAAIGAMLLVRIRRPRRADPPDTGDAPPVPRDPMGSVALGLVVAAALGLMVEHALRGNSRVIASGDEAHLWARKAKAMYAAGGFGPEYAALLERDGMDPHPDYPLLNPLLQTWVFVHAGGITHVDNRVPIQAFALAWVLILAGALRRHAGPRLAALFLLLAATATEAGLSARYVMADHMVALGFVAALDALARFRADGGARWWRLFAAALAFLAWSKSEGLMLALCALAACIAIRRDESGARASRMGIAPWAWLALPAGVAALQWAFNRTHGFESLLIQGTAGDPIHERIARFGGELLLPYLHHLRNHAVLRTGDTNLLFAAAVVAYALAPVRGVRLLGGAAVALGLGLLGYSLVYLSNGSVEGLDWHVGTSMRRVLFHLLPAAALFAAAAVRQAWPAEGFPVRR